MNQRQTGILQILLCGACFGFLGIFGKTAFRAGISPTELLSLRFLAAALMLGAFMLGKGERFWRLPATKILASLLLGILGYAVFSTFYFTALQGLSASLTVLLLYTYPVMVAVGGWFLLRERLGRRGWAALALCLFGMVGLVWGEWQVSRPAYLMFGIGSALFYAFYILVSDKVLKGVSPTSSTFYILLGAGGALALWSFRGTARPLEILSTHWPLVTGMAFMCSLLAMTLFQAGLQKLTSAEASILSTSEPLFGVLVAVLFLGESIMPVQVLGAALVLGALVLLATRPSLG